MSLELLRPFWLLALLPLAGVLWLLYRQPRRQGPWQRLLPPAFQPWLLQEQQQPRNRRPLALLLAGWLLAVLALSGPALRQPLPGAPQPAPLVVVLQMTPELLARDLPPDRLTRVRYKLADLLRQRQGASTAILLYAGSAHLLLPLSRDTATGSNLLGALSPALMPTTGQRADLAVQQAVELLQRSHEGRGRLLLLCNSLSSAEQAGIQRILQGGELTLDILGIGSSQGAPIPEGSGFRRSAEGAIEFSRLDSNLLAAFAASLDGNYRSLTSDSSDLQALDLWQPGGSGRASQRWQTLDAGHWLLLPLLLLAALGARRGWLLMLGGILLLPPPVQAAGWDDLWWRADQQGQQLLEQGRAQEAAQAFSDPQRQGIALYAAGQYSAAARAFAQGQDANAHYNRGNALALAGDLQAAVAAYERALQLDPQLAVARDNRERVLQQLENPASSSPAEAAQGDGGQHSTSPDSRPAGEAQPGNPPSPEQGSNNAPGAQGQGPQQRVADDPARADGLPADSARQSGGSLNASPRPVDISQWLQQIPDNPGELLQRKFRYEQLAREPQPSSTTPQKAGQP